MWMKGNFQGDCMLHVYQTINAPWIWPFKFWVHRSACTHEWLWLARLHGKGISLIRVKSLLGTCFLGQVSLFWVFAWDPMEISREFWENLMGLLTPKLITTISMSKQFLGISLSFFKANDIVGNQKTKKKKRSY